MAPNVFHIGVKEKVSISLFDNAQPVTVKLYLQDFPHRRKTFSQVQGVVDKGEFSFLKRQEMLSAWDAQTIIFVGHSLNHSWRSYNCKLAQKHSFTRATPYSDLIYMQSCLFIGE